MAYTILDGKINTYPSTKRASVNKLLTENSLTRIINRLIDNDSYVITNSLDGADFSSDIPAAEWMNAVADFEFVIHGYYFSIPYDEDSNLDGLHYLMKATSFDQCTDNSPHTLYARIFIDRTDPKFPELWGQRVEEYTGKYVGVQFFKDAEDVRYPDGLTEENCDYYDAPLVDYMAQDNGENFNFYVSLTSLFKFGSQSIKNIDGGEIIL